MLAFVALAYLWLVTGPSGEPGGTTGPAIGRRLEYLRLEGLTGDASRVSLDDLAGRVTLLNYWGTWCLPCIREFPQIVNVARQFTGRDDFRLYAVSCGQENDPELAELRELTAAFLQSRGAPFPAYADQDGASRQAMVVSLGVEMAYPTTLVLDRKGVIRGFWQGYLPRAGDEMSDLIGKLLAESDQATENETEAEEPGAEADKIDANGSASG